MRGLLGLNDHLGGQVSMFGTPIGDFHEHARLGYVPQRHTLSASVRATVEEVVAIGRLPHQGWFGRQNDRDRAVVREALELVGLADRARRGRQHPLRRPAAAGADRPSPRRRSRTC